MHGQWAMNSILTDNYDNNFTKTIGGISTNGCMHMNDAQGSSGINETNYWTLFGDPSLNMRTDQPFNLSVNHDGIILIGQEDFIVDVGIDGNLSSVCCSATADASCKIASVSSFETSDSMALNESPDSESTINPFNVCVIEVNSESASGMNLDNDDFKPFMVDIAGPIETIASPRS